MKKGIKIFGFTLSPKLLIILGVVIGIIVIATMVSNSNEQEEIDRRAAENERKMREAEMASATEEPVELSDAELEKKFLIETYGEPPEGFMWNDEGELYALSDDTKTAEQVVYTYLRSLSLQDFSTAQKYSKKSSVIEKYNSFFDESHTDADYYLLFLRKQFKFAVTSIEILNSEDSAVEADGTTVVCMKLKVLDLTNKDFWQKDKDTLFKDLRTYKQTEDDDIKFDQHIYDYIYSKYSDNTVGKHEITVNIRLDKEYKSGWLVADDSELTHQLTYEEGVNVASDIKSNYESWYEEVTEQEQEQQEQEEARRQALEDRKRGN